MGEIAGMHYTYPLPTTLPCDAYLTPPLHAAAPYGLNVSGRYTILLNLRWLAAIRAHLIVHAVTSGLGADRVKPFLAPDVNLDVATEVKTCRI